MHALLFRIIVHGKWYNAPSDNRLGGSHPARLSSASASTPRSHDNPGARRSADGCAIGSVGIASSRMIPTQSLAPWRFS